MSATMIQTIQEAIATEKEWIIHLRRHFRQYPEASLKGYETIKRIKEGLSALTIPFAEVGETGVLATIEGGFGASKTILLRADIGALELSNATGATYASKNPGPNHTCEHDGHAAALLGAVRVLKKHQGTFSEAIKLAFQPAEKIGAGAQQFVEGNYLEAIDQAFGIHLDSSMPVRKLVAIEGATNISCDIFKIEASDQSSHVAQSQDGRDAVPATASIVVELQKIVAYEIDPLDSVVVGIGVLQAGTRYNIVANQATIEGTVRTFSQETRQFVLQRVEEIAHEIAQSNRTEIADFSVYAAVNPLINEEQATNRTQQVASEIVGFENVVTDHPKSLGVDNFTDYLAVIPDIYGRIGSRNPENPATHFRHHHEQFDIDERALLLVARYHVRCALNYLSE